MNPNPHLKLKRVLSVFSAFFCACICLLSYFSMHYSINIDTPVLTGIVFSCISALFIIVMVYSRKQVLTVLSTLIMIPAMLPVLIYYYGNWEVIIPLACAVLIGFFLSGLKEGIKTTFSILYLLLYIIAALAYFIFSIFFSSQIVTNTTDSKASISNKYRYEVVNSKDSSNGSTTVYVEPNTLDYDFKLVKFTVNGFERDVYTVRPMKDKLKIEWKTETRTQITKEILDISKNITLNLNDAQKGQLGYNSDDDVYLSRLTDAELKSLGVADKGDVLYVDGKPVFRYYIAELEGYFDSPNKSLTSLTE